MMEEIGSDRYFALGLIGYPLGHSLSPRLHEAALKHTGLQGEYRLYPISPGVDFEGHFSILLEMIRNQQMCGLNVTIPHKQTVIPHLDRLSQTAKAIQAVNTIYVEEDLLIGENTDVDGFMMDLRRNLWVETAERPQIEGREERFALVLGAGGSARSVVFGLAREGWQVMLAARRIHQAIELCDSLGMNNQKYIFPLDYSGLRDAVNSKYGDVNLIVNTTPIGMWPDVNDTPWPSGLPFPGNCFIYDLVYNPLQTRLVYDALQSGHAACTGLGMLIEQAALAFEKWTGVSVSRQVMWQAVSSRICTDEK